MDRLDNRVSSCLVHGHLDMDRLEFVCSQEVVIFSAISNQLEIPHPVYDSLVHLHRLVCEENAKEAQITISLEKGNNGRPRIAINRDHVFQLLEMGLSVTSISKLLGLSRWTLQRRMHMWELSVRQHYSKLTDDELDDVVRGILSTHPNSGYRTMLGLLRAQGHRVQWRRLRASMHRVDTAGIVSRMSQLRCVVRRTYSVPGPRSLMHVDTNHKLIRLVFLMEPILALNIRI